MADVIVKSMSGPFAKALLVNHPAVPFDTVTPFAAEPFQTNSSQSNGDAVIDLAVNFAQVPNWLLILPYGEGEPGEQFSMRLWGVRRFTAESADPDRVVWVNYILGEYFCTICAQPGPTYNPTNANPPILGKFLSPTENLCDTITVTHGVPGLTNIVTSPGSDAGFVPGQTNLTASVLQDTLGSQKIYFDFQPENGTPTMNCMWGRA